MIANIEPLASPNVTIINMETVLFKTCEIMFYISIKNTIGSADNFVKYLRQDCKSVELVGFCHSFQLVMMKQFYLSKMFQNYL